MFDLELVFRIDVSRGEERRSLQFESWEEKSGLLVIEEASLSLYIYIYMRDTTSSSSHTPQHQELLDSPSLHSSARHLSS